MNIRMLPALLAGLCVQFAAHADNGSVRFQLDPMTTLADSATAPAGAGTVGHWVDNNEIWGSVFAHHEVPGNNDNARYVQFGPTQTGAAAMQGVPFGQYENVLPPLAGEDVSASARVAPGSLEVGWSSAHKNDSGEAYLDWTRSFQLDPNASITLSGLVSHVSSVPIEPFPRFETSPNWSDQVANMAVLYHRDDQPWDNGITNGINLIGRILNSDPTHWGSPSQNRIGHDDDFSYSADSFGRLSLTIFNHSDELMFGQFEIMTYAGTPYVIGIPEPATWATMLLGLVLLGGMARRRRASGV